MTDISDQNKGYLAFMRDIHEVSCGSDTRTYVWGGMVADIMEGRFLREHGDLDAFVEDMMNKRHALEAGYGERGYAVEFNMEFHMLKISKDGLHAAFNPLDIDYDVAMWRHIGDQGTVYFPVEWLDREPRLFYGINVYTAGILFDYCFRNIAERCNPQWKEREKDRVAKEYLKERIEAMGMDSGKVLEKIWSYNPFWARRGYDPFKEPVLVMPIKLNIGGPRD